MKNFNQESRKRRMRQYHRNHPWRLDKNGLMIPHLYPKPRELSWWDDFGFILNGRRIMVWWQHPRMQYADAIEDAAFAEAGEAPRSSRNFLDSASCTKHYKRLGRSRKKIVSYQSPPMAPDTEAYYDRLRAIQDRISAEGIDLVVTPSMTIRRLDWCIGVDLCIPAEVLKEEDVRTLASHVDRMLTSGHSLSALDHLFPGDYQYGREEWLAEADARQRDQERSTNDSEV